MSESGLDQMESWIREFPEQIEKSVEMVDVAESGSRPRSLVSIGMGGSAIGAQLVGALMQETMAVPLQARPIVTLPGFVGSEDLVVAVSYSGNTAETLAAAADATKRGCRLICITSGGALAEMAVAGNHDLIRLPGGISPRAALGYLFGAFHEVIEQLGLSGQKNDIVSVSREIGTKTDAYLETSGNLADLSQALVDQVPVVIGCGRGGPVARRIRCQLNENSKMTAFDDLLPELNHNSVVGWAGTASAHPLAAVLVDEDVDSITATSLPILETLFASWHNLSSSLDSALGRLLDLIHQGDAVSWHLARLRGVDPLPVDFISQIKAAQQPR